MDIAQVYTHGMEGWQSARGCPGTHQDAGTPADVFACLLASPSTHNHPQPYCIPWPAHSTGR
eukprot:165521-Pelagomonas_calceolata.AAC.1